MNEIQALEIETALIKGDLDEALDLLKAATHKYIRRIPTGKAKPKWRYVYSAAHAIMHGPPPALGEKVRVADAGQEGHYEVTAVHDDGHVTMKHDETGSELKVTAGKIRDMLEAEHPKAVEQAREKAKAIFDQAQKTGTAKQQEKAKQLATKLGVQIEIPLDPPKPSAPTKPEAPAVEAKPSEPEAPAPKPKKPSKARHGIEVQDAWEAAGSPAISGDERHEALTSMGDALSAAQDGVSKDDTGFSNSDVMAWARARTPARKAMILRKYRRQLTETHGDLYFQAGLHKPEPVPKGHIPTSAEWTPRGGLVLKVDGYLGTKFRQWKNLLQSHGFEWNGQRGTDSADGMPAAKAAKLDIPGFMEAAAQLGIHVDIPEKPEAAPDAPAVENEPEAQPEPAQVAAMTAAEAVRAIGARRLRDTIVVKRDPKTKEIRFYSSFSRDFNDIMSNKTGKVSGIFEVHSSDNWARSTYDLGLAEEALDKLKAAHPGWTFITEGIEDAKRERDGDHAELEKPIPGVAEKLAPGFKLFPYQNAMVRFLDSNDGHAIVGDEMGLGKTLQSLAWVVKNNKKVIVVVPKVVRRTWIEEAHKFFPGHFQAKELRSKDLKKGMPDLKGHNLVSVNYESLDKFMPALQAAGFDTIIVDESHRAKNPKAKTTKVIAGLAKTMKHVILMSGTAVKNKKDELFTQLEMVKPGLWGSAKELKFATIGGAWHKMRDHYLARSKQNVLKHLPPKLTTISTLYVPGAPDIGEKLTEPKPPPANATEKQREAYEVAREAWWESAEADEHEREMYGDDDEDRRPTVSVGEYSRLRVQLAHAKVPATVEMVNEILDGSDSKVLVFTESVAAAKAIAAELGDQAILHYGQQSDDVREAAKKEFQREGSPKRVFVSTRPSLAVGATLTAADKVVFNDLPWTAADIRQAEDRTHRVGQKNTVNVYWNVVEDNKFDENVTAILKRKYDLSKKINEGRQLSPEEKAWMEKPLAINDVLDSLKGKPVGPPATTEVADGKLVGETKKSELSMDDALIALEVETALVKGDLDEAIDVIEKAAGHKYIRRVPTGNPKKPYRYYYSAAHAVVDGVAPQVGEKVKVNDAGQEGHYEVTALHDDGHVTLRHDETGNEIRAHAGRLREMLTEEHAGDIKATKEKARQVYEQAQKTGTAKQQDRARAALEKLGEPTETEAQKQAKHADNLSQLAVAASSTADRAGTPEGHRAAMNAHIEAANAAGSGTRSDGHREAAAHHKGEADALANPAPAPPQTKSPRKRPTAPASIGAKPVKLSDAQVSALEIHALDDAHDEPEAQLVRDAFKDGALHIDPAKADAIADFLAERSNAAGESPDPADQKSARSLTALMSKVRALSPDPYGMKATKEAKAAAPVEPEKPTASMETQLAEKESLYAQKVPESSAHRNAAKLHGEAAKAARARGDFNAAQHHDVQEDMHERTAKVLAEFNPHLNARHVTDLADHATRHAYSLPNEAGAKIHEYVHRAAAKAHTDAARAYTNARKPARAAAHIQDAERHMRMVDLHKEDAEVGEASALGKARAAEAATAAARALAGPTHEHFDFDKFAAAREKAMQAHHEAAAAFQAKGIASPAARHESLRDEHGRALEKLRGLKAEAQEKLKAFRANPALIDEARSEMERARNEAKNPYGGRSRDGAEREALKAHMLHLAIQAAESDTEVKNATTLKRAHYEIASKHAESASKAADAITEKAEKHGSRASDVHKLMPELEEMHGAEHRAHDEAHKAHYAAQNAALTAADRNKHRAEADRHLRAKTSAHTNMVGAKRERETEEKRRANDPTQIRRDRMAAARERQEKSGLHPNEIAKYMDRKPSDGIMPSGWNINRAFHGRGKPVRKAQDAKGNVWVTNGEFAVRSDSLSDKQRDAVEKLYGDKQKQAIAGGAHDGPNGETGPAIQQVFPKGPHKKFTFSGVVDRDPGGTSHLAHYSADDGTVVSFSLNNVHPMKELWTSASSGSGEDQYADDGAFVDDPNDPKYMTMPMRRVGTAEAIRAKIAKGPAQHMPDDGAEIVPKQKLKPVGGVEHVSSGPDLSAKNLSRVIDNVRGDGKHVKPKGWQGWVPPPGAALEGEYDGKKYHLVNIMPGGLDAENKKHSFYVVGEDGKAMNGVAGNALDALRQGLAGAGAQDVGDLDADDLKGIFGLHNAKFEAGSTAEDVLAGKGAKVKKAEDPFEVLEEAVDAMMGRARTRGRRHEERADRHPSLARSA